MLNRNLRLVNVGLGLWVVLSSLFLWDRGSAISVNGWITGLIIIFSALLAIRVPVFRFVNAAAGVWLIASLFAWPIYRRPRCGTTRSSEPPSRWSRWSVPSTPK